MTFNSTPFGFDISTYQGAVDFNKMKAYGASFVVIRVGQGGFIDDRYPENKVKSRGVLPRSFYWFYDPRFAPQAQAQRCINAVAGESFSRLWIDMEFWWTGAYSAPSDWLLFRNAINAAGYKTGIYTSKTWWDEKVTSVQANEFAKDPCWAAQYNIALTRIPEGWTQAMIWQDSVPYIGIDAGASSVRIDHDLWNDEFNFEAEWDVPPPPPTGGSMATWKVIATTLNVRSGSSTAYPIIGSLVYNDVIEGVFDAPSSWIHISKKNGIGLDGWCSGNPIYVTLVTPPADKMTVIIEKNGVTTTYTSTGEIKIT